MYIDLEWEAVTKVKRKLWKEKKKIMKKRFRETG